MYTPKRMVKSGWISIDSKLFNDGMIEGCFRNSDGDWVANPDHDEIISRPNSRFLQLIDEVQKEIRKHYGMSAELDELRSSYENENVTDLKVTYTELRNGVLPL